MTGVATTPPSGDANPGNLSISGQREASNGFRVNGSDVEEDVNMGTSIVPNLDAIDSFRVLTSNFDAEYGNSSGGQMLVTTKSGTAQMHGSAFEFLRNTALDARNYFSSDRAAYRQNQYGGTPWAVAARLDRHSLFADYQGTRLTEGIDTGNISVPSMAERGGDFSQVPLTGSVSGSHWAAQLSSRLGRTVTPGEPYAQVFPDGQIPQSAWSAPAKYLLASIPQPNAGDALFATAAAGRDLAGRQGRAARGLDARQGHADGLLLSRQLFARQSLSHRHRRRQRARLRRHQSTAARNWPAWTHTVTFGAATLNEVHLSYMRNDNCRRPAEGRRGAVAGRRRDLPASCR